jgi:hypothetical protein
MTVPTGHPADRAAAGVGHLGLLRHRPRRIAEEWRVGLRVPHSDPFYFDRRLDHLPAILLVHGLLDLVSTVARTDLDDPGCRLRVALSLPAAGALGVATALSAAPGEEPGEWSVRAAQVGAEICTGRVQYRHGHRPVLSLSGDRPAALACAGDLVHRARPDNVLIGRPAEHAGQLTVPVLRPPLGHALRRNCGGRQRAHTVLEAGYQFAVMLAHTVAKRPLDSELGWLGVSADLPCAVPGATALGLRWPAARVAGRRMSFGLEVVDTGTRRIVGALSYDIVAVGLAAHRRRGVAGERHLASHGGGRGH